MARSKFKNYFIGDILSQTDNVFTQAKIEVLFNFTVLFLITNIPYCFLAFTLQTIHKVLAVTTVLGLLSVIIALKNFKNLKLAVMLYILNHGLQNFAHFFMNNGKLEEQGVLFFMLFVAFGFFLADRRTGAIISFIVVSAFMIGTYNQLNNFELFKAPPEIADPTQEPFMKYFTMIPIFMNIYLISQFIDASRKAEKQIQEQKHEIESKNKEVIDSIHYAKRIQTAVITSEKYIEKQFEKLKK